MSRRRGADPGPGRRARPGVTSLVAAALMVASTVVVSACGITADDSPRNIPDNAVPQVLRGSPDTTAPATATSAP